MKILILGAGPAGLMAAHAGVITNHDVVILSKKRKSYMRGAQYLHAPIPMHSETIFDVIYDLQGTAEGYRDKVYGDPRVQVSPESLTGQHFAWDIKETYDSLWGMYGEHVTNAEITSRFLTELLELEKPDLTFSSIPANILCSDPEHVFSWESVWVTEYYRGPKFDENVVICNGEPDVPWYRTSTIQGYSNTEYPNNKKPPLSEDKVHEVIKPIKTNCDCFPQVQRIGRYGTWTKGVLSHSAFYDTFSQLDALRSTKEHNQ